MDFGLKRWQSLFLGLLDDSLRGRFVLCGYSHYFFTLSQVSYVTAKKFSIVLGCSTSITTTKTWFLDDMVVCWYGAVVDGDQVEMTT